MVLENVCARNRDYHYTKLSLSNGMEAEETKSRVPSILWVPLIICVALLYFVDVFQINYYSITPAPLYIESKFEDKFLSGFAINTPGCKIPDMDPYDVSVKDSIYTMVPPICNNGTPALYEANLTSIYLLNGSLSAYNVSDPSELKCCYKSFWRIQQKKGQSDDKIAYSKECHQVTESADITDEFIQVICSYENMTIYKDMFAFVPLKNSTAHAATDPKPLNVLMVGLDAISRLNLHRQMPETLKFLQEIGAIELLGYNKVGDNTFPNLIPVLTGLYEGELKNSCIPDWKHHFDKCHFIWKDYKKKGFMTAYGEDSAWMGLFNYERVGFLNQSADYWYSYFNRESEKRIGNSHKYNVDQCTGARQVYKDFQTYIKNFVITMNKNQLPYFGFFWGVSLSHDFLNKPQIGDKDYKRFFKTLHSGMYLNNTVVVFMSDHGIRWGDIRQTFQGRMEERLPFVILLFPDWYKQQYPRAIANLKRNIRRLTTPFDLHATLVDLLNPFELTTKNLEIEDTKSRGISFFREISKYRTCEDAGIASHWCTCQQSTEIDTNSTDVINSANFAVEYINKQLEGYADCAELHLHTILNSRMTVNNDQIEKGKNKIRDYLLTLKTVPGEAIFEVTVRHTQKEKKYNITGTISRLNLYGQQSACITDFHLKLYCYCRNFMA